MSKIVNLFKRISKNLNGLFNRKISLFLVTLLLFLLVILGIQYNNPSLFKIGALTVSRGYLINFLQNSSIIEKSQANLDIEKDRLNINFKIAKKDLSFANQFAQNLGVDPKVFESISLELDKETVDKLKMVLPVTLNLDFTSKKVTIKDKALPSLKSSVAKTESFLATGSSKFNLKYNSTEDFTMEISDPGPLLNYATSSGQINLSNKMDGLFPILDKIARIELRVNGKSVSGEVTLK